MHDCMYIYFIYSTQSQLRIRRLLGCVLLFTSKIVCIIVHSLVMHIIPYTVESKKSVHLKGPSGSQIDGTLPTKNYYF